MTNDDGLSRECDKRRHIEGAVLSKELFRRRGFDDLNGLNVVTWLITMVLGYRDLIGLDPGIRDDLNAAFPVI